mgnify:CR=1 FL=1
MDILNALFRTIFFYFLVVLAYRIMGKREISQLEIIDLIVSILMAELIAISIENMDDSIILTIVPIVALVVLEIVLAKLSLKSRKFNELMSGKPSLLIVNGKIKFKELIKNRYSLDDILLELRQNGIKSLSDVEYAILEPNGKLSVFKYNILKTKSDFPLALIIDTVIQEDTLKYLKKDKEWLINKLHNKNILLNDVFYSFYKNNKIYIINKNK